VAVRAWNPTSIPRNVHWWSNAQQPADGDTEFVFPNEPVLAHLAGEESGHWPEVSGIDLRWHRNYEQMCGMFWEPTIEDWFGIYHHERGWGLLHLANPAVLPGKKLWSFGHTGDTSDWTLSMTRGGGKACEIQAGVPTVQNALVDLRLNEELSFVELWIPIDSRDELDLPKRPSYASVVHHLGGVQRLKAPRKEVASPSGAFWKDLIAAFQRSDVNWLSEQEKQLPSLWPPAGLDLQAALQWAAQAGGPGWRYQLGLWYCATEHWAKAQVELERVLKEDPELVQAQAMLGLLLWKQLGSPDKAWPHVKNALAELRDSQLFVHANALLRELGRLEERKKLLRIWPETDFRRRETEAELALDSGDPEEAIRLLVEFPWERHHCRYRRSDIWRAARAAMEQPTAPVPTALKEDPVQVGDLTGDA